MNLLQDEEEEEIQLPAYHVQSQPQIVTLSSQNQNLEINRQSEVGHGSEPQVNMSSNQNLKNIRQSEVGHGLEADTDDEEQFHGFNDHEISESADMYLGENEDEDEDPVDLSVPFPVDMNYCLGTSSLHVFTNSLPTNMRKKCQQI